jgi:TPR repeat protein
VVSLSDYDIHYRGGLYVGTGFGAPREYLHLNKGDAVLHRSTPLHGVQVYDVEPANATERWSWILWYRDSTQCRDYSHEWFADCAIHDNDAMCQQLHSTKVANIPGLTTEEIADQVLHWNLRAAQGGAGLAAVKIARAYLKQLPSALPWNVNEARHYFVMAMEMSHNPEGAYGLASLLLASAFLEEEQQRQGDRGEGGADSRSTSAQLQQGIQQNVYQAVRLLEEAAMAGHVYSMFNLGIAHAFGYIAQNSNDDNHDTTIDTHLAAEWFVASGLPEGYYVASQQAASVGNVERQELLEKRAKILGYGQVWRRAARERTGSGGAGGVDLNLKWPTSVLRGTRPPEF